MLPIGLGLLGFVEPCTIGAHLVFLDTQKSRTRSQKIKAVSAFLLTRTLVMGLIGAFIAFLGQRLIVAQTSIWLVFGIIYLLIGLVFLFNRSSFLKKTVTLAPSALKKAKNPTVLGIAFGLNIPACAAPILFALLVMSASSKTIIIGFMMMSLFGFFLSSPLVLLAIVPKLSGYLDRIAAGLKSRHWILGVIFSLLGLWSIWFGLYVDPANWVGTWFE